MRKKKKIKITTQCSRHDSMSKQNKKRGQTNLELNFGFQDIGIFRCDEIERKLEMKKKSEQRNGSDFQKRINQQNKNE